MQTFSSELVAKIVGNNKQGYIKKHDKLFNKDFKYPCNTCKSTMFMFLESERFFSKFQVEIAFFKFASIFSLMNTTYVLYYTTNVCRCHFWLCSSKNI